MAIKRTTHTWLKKVYDSIDGVGVTSSFGVSTSLHAFYGGSGYARVATGGNGIISGTYLGASGFGATFISPSGQGLSSSGLAVFLAKYADNGGSGTPYTFGDVVNQLKNMNMLPR